MTMVRHSVNCALSLPVRGMPLRTSIFGMVDTSAMLGENECGGWPTDTATSRNLSDVAHSAMAIAPDQKR